MVSDKGEVVIIRSVIKILVKCKQCVCNMFCNNGVNDM